MNEKVNNFGIHRDTVYNSIDMHSRPTPRIGRFWKLKKEESDECVKTGRGTDCYKKDLEE
jgi:hypothetical protein